VVDPEIEPPPAVIELETLFDGGSCPALSSTVLQFRLASTGLVVDLLALPPDDVLVDELAELLVCPYDVVVAAAANAMAAAVTRRNACFMNLTSLA